MGVNDSLYGLLRAIKASSEFTGLKQAKAVVSKNPGLKKDLDEFISGQKLLYEGKLSSRDADARAKQLSSKYGQLSKIPEIAAYLKAAEDFNRFMAKIYKDMGESLQKDLN